MDDNSPMPFGKYKGTALANVPANYLLWLLREGKVYGELKDYIIENEDLLIKESKSEE